MEDPEQLGSRVQNYLRDYKLFSEKLTNVIKIATQEKLTEELKMSIAGLVSDLSVDIDRLVCGCKLNNVLRSSCECTKVKYVHTVMYSLTMVVLQTIIFPYFSLNENY